MKRILVLAAIFAPLLMGFGSQHSKLETTSKVNGDEIALQFKISANNGMILTHQAPWQITLSNFSDLSLKQDSGKFVTKDYDDKLPGFTVKTKIANGAKSGKLDYKMKAFVCTTDKTRCYPQTHKGSLTWKK